MRAPTQSSLSVIRPQFVVYDIESFVRFYVENYPYTPYKRQDLVRIVDEMIYAIQNIKSAPSCMMDLMLILRDRFLRQFSDTEYAGYHLRLTILSKAVYDYGLEMLQLFQTNGLYQGDQLGYLLVTLTPTNSIILERSPQ